MDETRVPLEQASLATGVRIAGARWPAWPRVLATLGLLVLTAAVYARVYRFDYIDYDDSIYVTNNARVLDGLTWENVRWALMTRSMPYWHPLTWLSHMLDVQLWGPGPGPPHVVNAALHTANAMLVLLVLRQMTGSFWLSLITAALFALHPLRVESVAWVAERKDLLCALFYFLTIAAYVECARRPSLSKYLLVLLSFIAALMSKPMAVTLPCVLLLLDYWPLGRLRIGRRDSDAPGEPLSRLVIEKLPLFVLAIAVGIMAIDDQSEAGALKSAEYISLGGRAANALVAYVRYIGKIVWPTDLVIFYPHPGTWPPGVTIASAAALALATVFAVRFARALPFVIVGWLWFVGTLAPVIGVLQVGRQSMADRFTYIPSVGLTLAAVWGVAVLVERAPAARAMARVGVGVIIIALALLTTRQLGYWQGGTLGLFQHALDVDADNAEAHHAIGYVLAEQGKTDAAYEHLVRSRQLDPRSSAVHYLIGEILRSRGQLHDAIESYKKTVEIRPDSGRAWLELGITQVMAGDEAAERSLSRSLELIPNSVEAKERLAELRSRPATRNVATRRAE